MASLKVACFWKVGMGMGLTAGFRTVSEPLRDKEGDKKLDLVSIFCKKGCAPCDDQLPSRDRMVPLDLEEWTDRLSASETEPRRPYSHVIRCFEVVLLAILPETLPALAMCILRDECEGFRPKLPQDWNFWLVFVSL